MTKACVIVPAYMPDSHLGKTIQGVLDLACQPDGSVPLCPADIIVVDDGSFDCDRIFSEVSALGVTVLHHGQNKGKGQALKTAFRYAQQHGYDFAVTADADGQHSPADILRVLREAIDHPQHLVLGVRDLSQMPARSKFGNTVIRALFVAITAIEVSDTQTGLRAFGLDAAEGLLSIGGDRYEYEMGMLVHAPRLFAGVRQVSIATVYENVGESRFNPVVDSLRVAASLFRYLPKFLASSLTSTAVDYAIFVALVYLFGLQSVLALVFARIVSATVNYLINKNYVFKTKSKKYNAFSFFVLALGILAVHSLLLWLLSDVLGMNALLSKVLIETVVYSLNYLIQNNMASTGFDQQQ